MSEKKVIALLEKRLKSAEDKISYLFSVEASKFLGAEPYRGFEFEGAVSLGKEKGEDAKVLQIFRGTGRSSTSLMLRFFDGNGKERAWGVIPSFEKIE